MLIVLSFTRVRAPMSGRSSACCEIVRWQPLQLLLEQAGRLAIMKPFSDAWERMIFEALLSVNQMGDAEICSEVKRGNRVRVKSRVSVHSCWGIEPRESGSRRRLTEFQAEGPEKVTNGFKSQEGRPWTQARERRAKVWWLRGLERLCKECTCKGWWRTIFWALETWV